MRSASLEILIILFLMIPFSSAAHFIVGQVNDAFDGTSADGRTIVLWNPANGINDNLTDTIGAGGNSGTANTYMIDCELLNIPCDIGDNISVRVFNGGDGYLTYSTSVIVTGAGFDLAPDLRLNTPPNSTLVSPFNFANVSFSPNLVCGVSDLDGNLDNVTLYGNWSGGWHTNETNEISGNENSTSFSTSLPEGRYQWTCLVSDDLSISDYAENGNYTFTADYTPPVINSIGLNLSGDICGVNDIARVNCTVTDSLSGVEEVIIESLLPNGSSENFSAQILSGNTYYADIELNVIGEWNFTCYAGDYAGNNESLISNEIVHVRSSSPDLTLASNDIVFGNEEPIEGQNIMINATIYNLGCGNAENFLTGFYNGDPSFGGRQINGNRTLSIQGLENSTLNITWAAEIGNNNIFVLIDLNDSISEFNESNNEANRTINVTAWQVIYGNISIDKIIGNSNIRNLSVWFNESSLSGNIYIADTESNIVWEDLRPIGRNITGNSTSDDFSDLDQVLNMSGFTDSVSNLFTSDGNTPLAYSSFLIHQIDVNDVPIINSTNTENFVTGVLWDSSDDSDGEFSQQDREDIVLISRVNKESQGYYGIYDYEIKIPVRLRNYYENDVEDVYLYFDLN